MTNDLLKSVVEAAAKVVASEQPYSDLGFPQPGYVGPSFRQGRGVVIVMQNPSVSGMKDVVNERLFQEALYSFWDDPTISNYQRYVTEFLRQMMHSGHNGRGWSKWEKLVSPLLEGLQMMPEEIAWLNTVKYRMPEDKLILDTPSMRYHVGSFLISELNLLNPAAIVSHGSIPFRFIEEWRINKGAEIGHSKIPQPSQRGTGWSKDQIRLEGQRIRETLKVRGLIS